MNELNLTGEIVDGNFLLPLTVSGEGWTKVYYSFIKYDENQKPLIIDNGFVYPDSTVDEINHYFEPSMFGDFEYEYKVYSGVGKDNKPNTGSLLNSDSGTITIG